MIHNTEMNGSKVNPREHFYPLHHRWNLWKWTVYNETTTLELLNFVLSRMSIDGFSHWNVYRRWVKGDSLCYVRGQVFRPRPIEKSSLILGNKPVTNCYPVRVATAVHLGRAAPGLDSWIVSAGCCCHVATAPS